MFKKIMTAKKYNQEIERIKKENKQKEYKINIKREKDKYKHKIKFETSKFIAIYLFSLLNVIIIYAMIAMWKFSDFTYLGILISDIAAQVLIYAIYCMKAYKAKKSEEEMKFKRDRINGNLEDMINVGAESSEIVPTTTGSVEAFNTDSLG